MLAEIVAVIILKFEQDGFTTLQQKDVEGIANRLGPKGALWSGSTMFAHHYLSQNLGYLFKVC